MPKHSFSTDIVVSGGGVAGLTAAAAFGSAGFDVLCVDPAPPVTQRQAPGADQRTTAFLQPAVSLLKDAGLWEMLAPHGAELQIMRIVDAGGDQPVPRLTTDFAASEISDQPFGWNLPNWLLRREMVARLEALPNVTFCPGVSTTGLFTRSTGAWVSLSDGQRVAARLVLAADGRNSPMRQAAGISARTTRYGQKALAFTVAHDQPHQNISTEVHRSGGPFTLVPLPDRDGRSSSAVVWMARGAEVARLAALPPEAFEQEMNRRSAGVLGHLTQTGPLSVWPIIARIADRLSAQRVALVAEAAHVVPPIGAQGLNMSLADIRCLLDLARAAPDQLGDAAMLASYHRRRWPEIKARVEGVNLLNRASMAESSMLRDMRARMLKTAYALQPVRKTMMRAGLGAGG